MSHSYKKRSVIQYGRGGVKKFWQARGRGCKGAREEEKQVQASRQELTVSLGKGNIKGRKSKIFN